MPGELKKFLIERNVAWSRTKPYNFLSNGLCERFIGDYTFSGRKPQTSYCTLEKAAA